MNSKDDPIMEAFTIQCMSVNLVMNDSRNPATIKIGIRPITIFNPFLAPFLKESLLENVPGNRMLLPITKPAPPAIMIAEISNVPWIQMVRKEVTRSPFW